MACSVTGQDFCEGSSEKCMGWRVAMKNSSRNLCEEARKTAQPQCSNYRCVEFPCGSKPSGIFCNPDGTVNVDCLENSLTNIRKEPVCWEWINTYVISFNIINYNHVDYFFIIV